MKNLILYYSRKGENYAGGSIVSLPKGNTEIVAEFIRRAVKPYSAGYDACIKEAKAELQQNARPELKKYLDNISQYDNIFVCGPCWWGTYPCAVFSQLERLDFTGKRVFPVMTHEGSGLGRCESDLDKLSAGASFGEGLAVMGSKAAQSEKTVADWAKESVQRI